MSKKSINNVTTNYNKINRKRIVKKNPYYYNKDLNNVSQEPKMSLSDSLLIIGTLILFFPLGIVIWYMINKNLNVKKAEWQRERIIQKLDEK